MSHPPASAQLCAAVRHAQRTRAVARDLHLPKTLALPRDKRTPVILGILHGVFCLPEAPAMGRAG
jgi:hypothetical protein